MVDFGEQRTKKITNCGIANNCSNFRSIMKLPNLPLTEAFGEFDASFKGFDQELLISMDSGHVQLKYQVDPEILYDVNNYAFRSEGSLKSDRELRVLLKFLEDTLEYPDIRNILEIGANDLKLSKLLKKRTNSVTAVDPLLINDHGKVIDGIQVFGLPIEKVVKETKFIKPDLVIARHTLEHISNPKNMIESLLELVSKDCIFVFEVPSLMHIVESLRFDAIFHQHYNYFDLDSVKKLIAEIGGELINFTYNNQGSNGGSLIFAFRKSKIKVNNETFDHENKFNLLRARFAMYQEQMNLTKKILDELPPPVYGFGAGIMLAKLDYHLGGRLQNLECILDDDPKKDDMGYKNVNVLVKSTQSFIPLEQSSFVITSLESIRPIYNRIIQFNPRRIIAPPIL
jgi:hypothetical protein